MRVQQSKSGAVSDAAPWPEISTPPYFVAYHGSYTEGRHIGAVACTGRELACRSAPEDLKQGVEWTLSNESGIERKMRIIARKGDEPTISEFGVAERNRPS